MNVRLRRCVRLGSGGASFLATRSDLSGYPRTMVSATTPVPTRRIAMPIALVALAAILASVIDWFTLREAWLAEDAGPRFALGMTVLFLDAVRIGLLAPLVGVVSRNVGMGVGIAASAATFFVWRPIVGTLPGAAVADALEGTFVIPPWSSLLVLAWTVGMVGFWTALLWPSARWPRRLRNATPFAVGVVALPLAILALN